jgi:hypothetical protein
MDILYYSTNCKFCQKLLPYLAKNGLTNKMNFVCVDRRARDPKTQQIQIVLDNGAKVALPPNVHRVPTLVIISQNYRSVVGEEIYAYLEPFIKRATNLAIKENGEPSGFVLGGTSGGVNIVSETFTYYDTPAEELLAKGTGKMRQMHNYTSAGDDGFFIPTPEEKYKPDKLGGETTLEYLMQKRNEELQASAPSMANQLNQAIMPNSNANAFDIKPPIPAFNQAQSRPAEDPREVLFGKNSGWSGSFEDDRRPSASPPAYMINI